MTSVTPTRVSAFAGALSPTRMTSPISQAPQMSQQTPQAILSTPFFGSASSRLTAPGADAQVQFKGDMSGAPASNNIKISRRMRQQLQHLSELLDVPVSEVATKAAWLVTQTDDARGMGDRRFVGLVNREALENLFQGHPPSSYEQNQHFSRFDVSRRDWQAFRKTHVQKLSLSRSVGKKFSDRVSPKEPFQFTYHTTSKATNAAVLLVATALVPPLQIFLPLTIPNYLLSKGNPKQELANGLNVLEQAVRAKQQDPSLVLVSIRVNTRSHHERNHAFVFMSTEDKIFRNLIPSA